MKQRLITSAVALVLLSLALSLYDTWFFNLAVAVVLAVAALEMLHAVGCGRFRLLTGIACLYSAAIPFIPLHLLVRLLPLISYAYIAALFLILLKCHRELSALQAGFTFFITIAMSFALSTSVYFRDLYGAAEGMFLCLASMGSAWLCDTGAYFTGRAFGKHKLSPEISPKKTIEGAIGGVIVCVPLVLLIGVIYQWAAGAFFGLRVQIHYLSLAVTTLILAIAGMLGDLTASVIKRQHGVKDYGHILPGHGGVMDRFDSVLFTAPTMFLISQYVTLISIS